MADFFLCFTNADLAFVFRIVSTMKFLTSKSYPVFPYFSVDFCLLSSPQKVSISKCEQEMNIENNPWHHKETKTTKSHNTINVNRLSLSLSLSEMVAKN